MKGRYFKNQKLSDFGFYLKYIIGVLIFLSFFVINYTFNRIYL